MSKEVRILIVEDEFMISEDIAYRLSDFGYSVEGIATSAEQALDILENGQVDLALLDVNIEGEMDGIELSGIIATKYKIPFIFLTSLANSNAIERAKASKPSAYLLKPFNDRQVQIAIEIALTNFAENTTAKETDQLIDPHENPAPIIQMKDSLFLKKDTHFDRVKFEDIYYLSAENSYTTVFTRNGNYIYSCLLKKFYEKMPSDTFVRVHRSYIININQITGFEGNHLFLGELKIPVSKAIREELFKNFKIF
ncbi:MAG: LytTR family transcriptional regulator DNA-binding domain-containing protein [Prolixibacteraceae bacterium]|nr:LytTR family transcriptional regulator DNA-binding domain-containing protein [Prolixibacteraceae bacterium]